MCLTCGQGEPLFLYICLTMCVLSISTQEEKRTNFTNNDQAVVDAELFNLEYLVIKISVVI